MDARDIIAPAAAITIAATSATAGSAAYNPELNKPSYWGGTCIKTDMSGESMTYSVDGDNVSKVIVKGGTENKVYTQAPFTNLTAPINPNTGKPYAISHVIVCSDGSTAPAATTSTAPTAGQGGGQVNGQSTSRPEQTQPAGGRGEASPQAAAVAGVADEVSEAAPEQIASTGPESVVAASAGIGGFVYALTHWFRRKK